MFRRLFFLSSLFFILSSQVPAVETPSSSEAPVFIIPVNEEISPFLVVFLKRSILKAEAAEASLIIFELNTFGGRVDSALEITSLIGSVQWAETVAYIPSGAGGTGVSWSAGALISFSCDSIYMDSGTSIGAAAPVYQSAEGMVMAEEKVVSAVRGQMSALAEKNGYSSSIALAMVDPDIELYEVDTGESMILLTPDEIAEAERISGVAPVQGKLVSAVGKLLTLTAGEMEKYGVSSATVSGRADLHKLLSVDNDSLVILEKTNADWVIAFLSSAAVASLLVMLGMVALYMEVTSPGFGVPGTIALICFAIVFASSTLIGNLGSLELILFMLGVVLLLIEVFIIPGFGVTGVSGIILILLALVLTRQDFVIPEFTWQWDLFRKNLLFVSLSLVGSLILIGVLMVTLPHSHLFGRLVLKNTSPAMKKIEESEEEEISSGARAVALTNLRPVGKADFNGKVLVVQTDGEFIEKDSQIIVVRKEGLRLVVKRG
ncbi:MULTISPECIES: nodulation protein NfeD [unclassified Oceanispirochaeta]|uniref:NfeD family protein n=1 Tax=unclassified Oceanispirochaeta TaxID=2635722 RepID=UPI000E09D039|nr:MULTISPECIES: NfeD family protein [unclassified Oceanispirochaeta]MBF9016859.1 nodulation protein NfeD [Oceanispirochaeta sp. M2]NPD73222.1 nodulation protein NfeD [Oceanispirochaeta sp. M1]RDG31089.1 nodulation protein NfeD [Oceanispirochaeta sp. M1]